MFYTMLRSTCFAVGAAFLTALLTIASSTPSEASGLRAPAAHPAKPIVYAACVRSLA